jgi:hypothetical protein
MEIDRQMELNHLMIRFTIVVAVEKNGLGSFYQ